MNALVMLEAVLAAAVAGYLLSSGQWRRHRLFFAYILWYSLGSAFLYGLWNLAPNTPLYSWSYFAVNAAGQLLGAFLVVRAGDGHWRAFALGVVAVNVAVWFGPEAGALYLAPLASNLFFYLFCSAAAACGAQSAGNAVDRTALNGLALLWFSKGTLLMMAWVVPASITPAGFAFMLGGCGAFAFLLVGFIGGGLESSRESVDPSIDVPPFGFAQGESMRDSEECR